MAIQAQMYPENLGLPLMGPNGGGGGVFQDWLFNNLSNTNQNTNNMVFYGCGFNDFNDNLQQQKQQQQFQFQQQQQVLLQLQQQYLLLQNQQQRNSSCENNNINNNDGFMFLSSSKNCTSTTTASTTTTTGSDYNQIPVNFSPCFADQLEKQRVEIDRFVALQNERLKLALQEQRKQQLSTIMRKFEAKATQMLTQKDEEIARATKRSIELQDIITKMEFETQEWQRLATENEAMVVSLSNTLEQLKEQPCCTTSSSCSSNEVGDAESCCNFSVTVAQNKEGLGNSKEGFSNSREVLCKVCKTGKSSILMLPCRHLCCCKGCEAFVDACPVCKSAKMASIEALIS